MGKIKMTIARFVADKFFKEEVKDLKDRYYGQEKSKVQSEIRVLENNLIGMQKEYSALQNQKFLEVVNSDLQNQKTKEQQQEQSRATTKENSKDPFADWGI